MPSPSRLHDRTAWAIVAIAAVGTALGVAHAWGAPVAPLLAVIDLVLLIDVGRRARRSRWTPWLAIDAISLLGTLGWMGFPMLHALRVARLQTLLRLVPSGSLNADVVDDTPQEQSWRQLSLAATAAYAIAAILVARLTHGRPDLVPLLVTVPTGHGVATIAIAWMHARALAAQRTRALLSLALPRQVAEHLARNPEHYHEASAAPATIVFVDIEGFTATVERLQGDHVRLKKHLEAAFEAVVRAHVAYDLIVDKFIGDAVMSFRGGHRVTGTPEEHAARVVLASLASLEALATLGDPYFRSAKIGGASTESALIGTFATSNRLSYTVLGDGVNLASRLESANRLLGTRALFCDRTRALTEGNAGIAWRRVGKLAVKGKAEPQDVWEALVPAQASDDWMAPFAEALALFEARRFADAWELFAEVDALRPGGDGPSRVYLTECNHIVGAHLPADWQPVLRAA